jgi:hypothetical protein
VQDWSGPVRDPLDVLRIAFLVGAVVALVLGDLNSAVRLGLTFGLVFLARQISLPRPFDLAFLIGMSLQGWGNVLGLFDDITWYDKVVHFVLPLAVAPVFYILLIRLDAVPDLAADTDRRHYAGIILITTSLGFAFGAAYEIYEYVAVHAFSANLAIGYADTIGDLGDDLIGSLLGGVFLVIWAQFGWATTRRVELPPDP